MNVYVPCRVSARDQGEHVVNVWHVLGQRIVDSVTSARYCVLLNRIFYKMKPLLEKIFI